MNKPTRSKINWTALLMALVGLAISFDLVPEQAREPLTEITMILGPSLVVVFRTWFTGPK